MTLEFEIKNQEIKRKDTNKIVANSIEYLKAKFEFSADWANTTKIAFFTYNEVTYQQVLNPENECYVPEEVIKTPNFILNVIGYGNGSSLKITSGYIRMTVYESGAESGIHQAIRTFESDTLDFEQDSSLLIANIPNKYGTSIKINSENGKLQLIGRDNEVLNEISLPSDKYIEKITIDDKTKTMVFTFSDGSKITTDISSLYDIYKADNVTLELANDTFKIKGSFITSLDNKYVAQEEGKGLSTNDFTDTDKENLLLNTTEIQALQQDSETTSNQFTSIVDYMEELV